MSWLVFKICTYGLGKLFVWWGESIPLPHLLVPPKMSDVRKLFKVIARLLDRWARLLKNAGVLVKKKVGRDGSYYYRFFYKGQLIYHFSMHPRTDEAHNAVGFYDGWTEPDRNAYTAFGIIHNVLGVQNPRVSVYSLSLICDKGLPGNVIEIPFEELAELIWEKASRIIEQRTRQKV